MGAILHTSRECGNMSIIPVCSLPFFPPFLLALFSLHPQCTLVGLLPGVGWMLSLLHLAMLYALYTFEYKWINEGGIAMFTRGFQSGLF